jgi:hypothetical protein
MYPFLGERLAEAIVATFRHRGTTIEGEPVGLTEAYRADPARVVQWRAFVRRSRFGEEADELMHIINEVRSFVLPVLSRLAAGKPFNARWKPGGPWE